MIFDDLQYISFPYVFPTNAESKPLEGNLYSFSGFSVVIAMITHKKMCQIFPGYRIRCGNKVMGTPGVDPIAEAFETSEMIGICVESIKR